MKAIKPSASSSLFGRLTTGFVQFVSAPASPAPLSVFRIGVAAVLLFEALSLSQNLLDLYGNRGIVQWQVMDSTVESFMPRLRWATDALAKVGVSDAAAVKSVFLIYVAALASLLLGYRTRAAAIVAYLGHVMMKSSAGASIYGVDVFAQIALFYCILMPVGATFSLDRSAGRETGEPSSAARLGLRVLQIHLCIMYLACGLDKSAGEDWWNGEAIWCALMRSDLCAFNMSWLAAVPLVPRLLGLGTLLVEAGYPIFVWPRRTRTLWALATIGLHVGIAIFMGLYSFSAMMSVFTFSMWLVSATPGKEWAAFAPLVRLTGLFRRSQRACQAEAAI
jgi:hypothetical protein